MRQTQIDLDLATGGGSCSAHGSGSNWTSLVGGGSCSAHGSVSNWTSLVGGGSCSAHWGSGLAPRGSGLVTLGSTPGVALLVFPLETSEGL